MPETSIIESQEIVNKIYDIRGQNVMLDQDLAELSGVTTKRLNEQLKRNSERFPSDFAFQLTKDEWESLRSQFATLKNKRGQHRKFLPYVFTEYGVLMLASILNSELAIAVNKRIVKAFVELRKQIQADPSYALLQERLKRIEAETKLLQSESKTNLHVQNRHINDLEDNVTEKVNDLEDKVTELFSQFNDDRDAPL